MIELFFTAAYLLAASLNIKAFAPAMAFLLSSAFGFSSLTVIEYHAVSIIIYCCFALLCEFRTANFMILSTLINLLCVIYFLSPIYLEYYEYYFMLVAVTVNLCILFSLFDGSDKHDRNNITIATCINDFLNLEIHSKTSGRG